MFEFVRNNTRLALGFVLLLIIPSFVFFGIDGYKRFTDGTSASVAKVDGVSITRGEWENAHQRVMDRARRENPAQDTQSLDTPAARRDTLDRLLTDRVLLAAANQLHLTPTDDRLRRLQRTPWPDPFEVARLKKLKLALKDRLARVLLRCAPA